MRSKNKKMSLVKRLGVCVLSVVMLGLLTAGAFAAPAVSNVTVQLCPHFNILVDGVSQTFYNVQGQEVHPIVYNGTTYLPVRAIGELMDKNVNWDQSTKTVTLSGPRTAPKAAGVPDANAVQSKISAQIRPDFTIVLDGAARSFADANGTTVYPMLYNGTTYLPVRAIGQLSGFDVKWDGATKTVSLTTSSGSLVTDADSFNQNPGQNSGTTTAPSTPPAQSATMITAEAAKAKALAHAGLTAAQVTFVSQKLEWEDGRQVYDVEFYTSDYREYDYEIDAYTGAILSYDYDAEHYSRPATGNNGSYIGEAKVRSIVLARVPGATASNIVKLKLDFDDGRWQYEGEIIYGNMEYEFEVDAYSGAILSWEAERR